MIFYMLIAPLWIMLWPLERQRLPQILTTSAIGMALYLPTMLLYGRLQAWDILSPSPLVRGAFILLRDHLVILGLPLALGALLFLMFRSRLEGRAIGELLPPLLSGYYVALVFNTLIFISLPLNLYEGFILPSLRISQYCTFTLLLQGGWERWPRQLLLIIAILLLSALIGTLIWHRFLFIGALLTLIWIAAALTLRPVE